MSQLSGELKELFLQMKGRENYPYALLEYWRKGSASGVQIYNILEGLTIGEISELIEQFNAIREKYLPERDSTFEVFLKTMWQLSQLKGFKRVTLIDTQKGIEKESRITVANRQGKQNDLQKGFIFFFSVDAFQREFAIRIEAERLPRKTISIPIPTIIRGRIGTQRIEISELVVRNTNGLGKYIKEKS